MPKYFETSQGRRIAYHKTEGNLPSIVFLGGFKSDMEGSKATFLENWAKNKGYSYLRFDYSGHGQSSGKFIDGCIGNWLQDAEEVIKNLTEGSLVLIGSSMGGWISLLLARKIAEKIVGLLTIAAAPDFTQDSMWQNFSKQQREEIETKGITLLPSDYGEPYPITKRLIEEGKDHLIFRVPMKLNFPVRLLQGSLDTSVTRMTALKLFDHLESTNLHLTFIKDGDHSLSTPNCLEIIKTELVHLLKCI